MSVTERTDHEVAEAIRDGVLSSPQPYQDKFWLFDLRITGTGAAYRDSINEYTVRDPEQWLSPAFLERCAGLPVVFEHPPDGLNHDEWERAVGTIVLPYVKDDEVRGVAKIYDRDAAVAMQTTHISTSPGVTAPKDSETLTTESGARVLAEGLPLILDHLAVCKAGVWDKGGPPDGVRLDSATEEGPTVADKDKDEKDDSVEKMDSAARADMRKRLDEADKLDAAKSDAAKKDEPESEKEKDKDEDDKEDEAGEEAPEDRGKSKDDKKKDTAEEKAEKDLDKDDSVKKDEKATVCVPDANLGNTISDAALTKMKAEHQAEIRRLEAKYDKRFESVTKPLAIDERNAISKTFHRVDAVLMSVADRNTPQHMQGESSRGYRVRCADYAKKYSPKYKSIVINDSLDGALFDVIEEALYADVISSAKDMVLNDSAGAQPIAIETTWQGKPVTEYRGGDPATAWAEFMPPTVHIVKRLQTPQPAR